eukprot:g2583.t1
MSRNSSQGDLSLSASEEASNTEAGAAVTNYVGRNVPKPSAKQLRKLLKSLVLRGRRERWLLPHDDIGSMEARPFAEGQFGTMTKARWRGLAVACKQSRRHSQASSNPAAQTAQEEETMLRNLVDWGNEVDLLTTLRHPNLVMFLGACISENGFDPPPMFVLEFMPNGNLEDYLLKRNSPLSTKRVQAIALEFARGMTFLHGCQPPVIHRDLKPANLLFDADMHLRIADFGTSRMINLTPQHYCGGSAADGRDSMTGKTGSYRYMAPEVWRNEIYDEKADVYSFAIIMWFVAAGQPPFIFDDPAEIAVRASDPREQRRPAGAVLRRAKHVQQIVERSWHADPKMRPTSEQILDGLENVAMGVRTPPGGWFAKSTTSSSSSSSSSSGSGSKGGKGSRASSKKGGSPKGKKGKEPRSPKRFGKSKVQATAGPESGRDLFADSSNTAEGSALAAAVAAAGADGSSAGAGSSGGGNSPPNASRHASSPNGEGGVSSGGGGGGGGGGSSRGRTVQRSNDGDGIVRKKRGGSSPARVGSGGGGGGGGKCVVQ